MRIKTFTAKTIAQAMADVRREIGSDAVIIQIEEPTRKTPARVVAAIDQAPLQVRAEDVVDAVPENASSFAHASLQQLFAFHGVADTCAHALISCLGAFDAPDLTTALAHAFDLTLRFRPFSVRVQSSAILVGQSGQGKSLTAMRLAAAAHAAGRAVRLVTLDGQSSGALAQMDPFCQALGIPLHAMTAEEIRRTCFDDGTELTIVDTTGINPYALPDIAELSHILASTKIEPLWVTACGADSGEFLEQARIFREFGVQRVIATRADSCRRFGALINLLAQSGMALAGISASPLMSEPLLAATPEMLAQKLTSASHQPSEQKIAA